jgi:ribokinase
MILVAGSLNLDLVGRAPKIPAPGETVLGGELASCHGGKGGNQAVAAARLGAQVAFAGAVGNDAAGAELIEGLACEGIDVRRIERVDRASGAALITVSRAGENAITVLPGANLAAPPPRDPWPGEARLLLLQLEVPFEINLAWAEQARAAGATVVLNAAPYALLPPRLLALVDTLIVNRHELHALAGAGDLGAALATARALGPRAVIATLGSAGCAGIDAAGRRVDIAAHPVAVVDSTGAGDTLAGAFAAATVAGLDFAPALQRANVAAALSCTRAGARGGMPRAPEVDRALVR